MGSRRRESLQSLFAPDYNVITGVKNDEEAEEVVLPLEDAMKVSVKTMVVAIIIIFVGIFMVTTSIIMMRSAAVFERDD